MVRLSMLPTLDESIRVTGTFVNSTISDSIEVSLLVASCSWSLAAWSAGSRSSAWTRRLLNEQDDGCEKHKRRQGRGDRPAQPRLARLSAQMQNPLTPQDVGR